jgi:ABC-2 type transport system permease protein
MLKSLIRVLAFFAKELADIRRQPRLLLSLVLGPFLILLLFGLSFQGERPLLRTLLVIPSELEGDPRVQQFQQAAAQSGGFEVVDVVTDEQAALERMMSSNGAVDLVEVLPNDLDEVLGRSDPLPIRVFYNEIDPLQEQWIQYLTYVQTKELNTAFLLSSVGASTDQLSSATEFVSDARRDLQQIQGALETARSDEAREAIERIRNNSDLFLAGLALLGDDEQGQQAQEDVETLRTDLNELERAIDEDRLEEQQERLDNIDARLAQVERVAELLEATPPEVLVSPLYSQPVNMVQQPPSFVAFYAPGVLALLLQHMAVSMAALSLVREQLLGTTELFRVAPVNSAQIILGKYIGFIVAIGLIAAALIGLLVANIPIGTTGYRFGLGIPFAGNWPIFVGMLVLLIVASLGIGFVISSVSRSESQAVQLTMLALLASVFFSGFFLPLENFTQVVRWLSYGLPVAHGVEAFQSLMLRGTLPRTSTVLWLGGIALACFLLTLSLWTSYLRRR